MRSLIAVLTLWLLALPGIARAEVEVGFWSRELGGYLPHAFITLKGTAGGKRVETSYGYTAKSVTPSMLFGPVPGTVMVTPADYIAKSHRHFTVTVDDARYAALLALVARWSSGPAAVYRLNSHNCVHFAGEAAQIVGLKVEYDKRFLKRPTSFLRAVAALNAGSPMLKAVQP